MSRDYQYLLIIDDHAGVRRLLFEVLTDEGYNVEIAASGTEGIKKAFARIPSLILLDAKMPGKDGFETLNEITKFAPDVPVIMITAYTELGTVLEAAKHGIIKHIARKPFDLDDLRLLIRSVLSGNRMEGISKKNITAVDRYPRRCSPTT